LLAAQVVFRAGEAFLPLLLAAWFGRSNATDVYYFSWAAFAFAGSLIFSAFQDSSIVPILAEVRIAAATGTTEDARTLPARVRGSLLVHTWILGGILSAVIGMLALGVFALRYDGAELALAAKMVPLFCLFLVALATKTFLVAVLNGEKRFFAHPLAGAIGTVATIGLLASFHATAGVVLVPLAALAGEVTQVVVLAHIAFGQLGLPLTLTTERPEPIARFVRLAASEVGGGALTRVNPIVDQLVAGMTGVLGAGTLLRYSGDVSSILTSLLQASLLPVLLSYLSDDFGAGNVLHFRRTVSRALLSVCAVLGAASFLVYLVRAPLLRLIFLRGEMDAGGVDRMIEVLPYHLVGAAPFGALLVLARAHVAMKNSRIMVSMGLLNAVSNVVFDVLFAKAIGLKGIALATSCVHLTVAIVFWFRLEAHLRTVRDDGSRTSEVPA